jgi:hypothetical protein
MLDPGVGDGIGAGIAAGMQAFKQVTAEGRFAINETGGKALLEAFREMAAWVDGKSYELNLLAQQPQLGSSNGANTMKPYVQQVATDQEGFITMLKEFRESLADAEQGVLDAMNNYQQLDHGTAQNFREG